MCVFFHWLLTAGWSEEKQAVQKWRCSLMTVRWAPPPPTTHTQPHHSLGQETRAAGLVLWPHPSPMRPGLTVGMDEGLAWQSWALFGGRDSSSCHQPLLFTLVQKAQAGEELKPGGGEKEGGRMEWDRKRGNTGEIDEGLVLCCHSWTWRSCYRPRTLPSCLLPFKVDW